MRTDKEIVDQTEALARKFAEMNGWQVPPRKKMSDSVNPRFLVFWEMACQAQKVLTNTDPSDALSNVD